MSLPQRKILLKKDWFLFKFESRFINFKLPSKILKKSMFLEICVKTIDNNDFSISEQKKIIFNIKHLTYENDDLSKLVIDLQKKYKEVVIELYVYI